MMWMSCHTLFLLLFYLMSCCCVRFFQRSNNSLTIPQKSAIAREQAQKTKEDFTMELNLSKFAHIGKGVITKAIGLQENYAVVFEKAEAVLDEEASGCAGCPAFQEKCRLRDSAGADDAELVALECQCKSCPKAVFTERYDEKKKYINEKNMFGYQPTLKSNAIKLLLAYHFMMPDCHGIINDVSLKGLAELLGCAKATVLASNKMLADYGYCCFCNSGAYDGHINVILNDCKNYYKTAEEGGRGYITMSLELFEEILKIDGGLNALRLNIKGILEVDSASYRHTETPEMESATASYKKLRGFLPGYCKRNVIVKALDHESSIFDFTCSDSSVTFSLKPEFAQKNMRQVMMEEEEAGMKEYVGQVNATLFAAGHEYEKGADPLVDARLSRFGIITACGYGTIILTEENFQDLASMCMQYGRERVRQAVIDVYNGYTLQMRKIINYGGLVRTLIRVRMGAFKAAA